MLDLDSETTVETANLVSGWKQAGPGRPSSKVRKRAGRLYDIVLDEMAEAVACHREAKGDESKSKDRLNIAELARISAEVKTIGVGELKSVELANKETLKVMADEIGSFVLSNLGNPVTEEMGRLLFEAVYARLNDV